MAKKAKHIGIHIPLGNGFINVYIILDKKKGNHVSFCQDGDVYEWKVDNGYMPWCESSNHRGDIRMLITKTNETWIANELFDKDLCGLTKGEKV